MGCTFRTSAKSYFPKLSWLRSQLDDTREDVRENMAQLYALVASQMQEESSFDSALAALVSAGSGSNLELRHGLTVCMGYAMGRRRLLERLEGKKMEETKSYQVEIQKGSDSG